MPRRQPGAREAGPAGPGEISTKRRIEARSSSCSGVKGGTSRCGSAVGTPAIRYIQPRITPNTTRLPAAAPSLDDEPRPPSDRAIARMLSALEDEAIGADELGARKIGALRRDVLQVAADDTGLHESGLGQVAPA